MSFILSNATERIMMYGYNVYKADHSSLKVKLSPFPQDVNQLHLGICSQLDQILFC